MKYSEALNFLIGKRECLDPYEFSLKEQLAATKEQEISFNNGQSLVVTRAIVSKMEGMIRTALRDAEVLGTEFSNIDLEFPKKIVDWIVGCAQTEGPLREEVSILALDKEIANVFTTFAPNFPKLFYGSLTPIAVFL